MLSTSLNLTATRDSNVEGIAKFNKLVHENLIPRVGDAVLGWEVQENLLLAGCGPDPVRDVHGDGVGMYHLSDE